MSAFKSFVVLLWSSTIIWPKDLTFAFAALLVARRPASTSNMSLMATVFTNASVEVSAGAAKAAGLSTGDPDNTGTASATALANITLLIVYSFQVSARSGD